MFASFLSFFFKLYILCLLLSFPSSAFLFCRSCPAFCLQSFRTLRVYPRFFPSSLLPSFLPFVVCGVVVASMQLPENASKSQDTMPANANEEVATAKREEKKRCICFIRSSAASSKRSSSQRVSSEEGLEVGIWPLADMTPKKHDSTAVTQQYGNDWQCISRSCIHGIALCEWSNYFGLVMHLPICFTQIWKNHKFVIQHNLSKLM